MWYHVYAHVFFPMRVGHKIQQQGVKSMSQEREDYTRLHKPAPSQQEEQKTGDNDKK
ncbi:hypothetical protein [Arsenophonus endosymbiont of Crataerina pallida]|uniref:hypothetical protein n=1 Tax=Arsenophonus endosymbiont of Crataerina pallida TaxID=3066235 RepID=UPI0030CBCFA1